MLRRILSPALLILCLAGPASAKTKVVASVPDLASIAAYVGGDQVEVKSLARSNADPHRVEVLPSYMVRVSKAQVFLKVGLYLDQWADQIIDGSRNDKLLVQDCSVGIEPLEVPTGRVDARQGDVHPLGNPHYWLDPRRAAQVASTIAAILSRADPEHAALFEANAARFAEEAARLYEEGRAQLASLSERSIVSYHTSWSYLADAFDLSVALTVEPVPGIPPTGKHLSELVTSIRERGILVMLQEPYFSKEASEFLARETGIQVVPASPSCEKLEADGYFDHLRSLLSGLALAEPGS